MASWSVRVGGERDGYIGMRISGGKVYLPGTSTLGYGKYEAEPGDFIVFETKWDKSTSGLQYGRVLGRISSHDSVSMGGPDFVGHIAVLWFHNSLAHASLRMVAPKDVVECYDPNADRANLGKFLQFMVSVPINAKNVKHLYAAERYGSLSYHYVDNTIARIEGTHKDSDA